MSTQLDRLNPGSVACHWLSSHQVPHPTIFIYIRLCNLMVQFLKLHKNLQVIRDATDYNCYHRIYRSVFLSVSSLPGHLYSPLRDPLLRLEDKTYHNDPSQR
jgi:hypothetical protein